MTTKRHHPITVGSRVAYSAAFLRSLAIWAGSAPQMRGQVEAVEPFGDHAIALVAWDDGSTARVLTLNLTLEARIAADAAMADHTHA